MDWIISWNVHPEIFRLGFLSVRWYGLLFATAFLLGSIVMNWILKRENKAKESLDRILLYMLAAVIIGARLGECLFYNPDYYLSHPLEIFKIWKGGLASHGAVIGIMLALYFYSKNTSGQSYIWILDRIVIAVALGGTLVRIGNFFNSEIIGKPTNSSWGVVFERIDSLPRHPAQLYESFTYFSLFIFLLVLYRKIDSIKRPGILFGAFLSLGFTARFLIEFVKENQVGFEAGWDLNIGQMLSIPVVLIGIGSILWGLIHPRS